MGTNRPALRTTVFSGLLILPFIWATTILEHLRQGRHCVLGTELDMTGQGFPRPQLNLVGETSMWAGRKQ